MPSTLLLIWNYPSPLTTPQATSPITPPIFYQRTPNRAIPESLCCLRPFCLPNRRNSLTILGHSAMGTIIDKDERGMLQSMKRLVDCRGGIGRAMSKLIHEAFIYAPEMTIPPTSYGFLEKALEHGLRPLTLFGVDKSQWPTIQAFLRGTSFVVSTTTSNHSTIENVKFTLFWTTYECLLLLYEQSLTRLDSIADFYYDCFTYMPWVGERTRQLDSMTALSLTHLLHNPNYLLNIYIIFGDWRLGSVGELQLAFWKRNGTQIVLDGGQDSYWVIVGFLQIFVVEPLHL